MISSSDPEIASLVDNLPEDFNNIDHNDKIKFEYFHKKHDILYASLMVLSMIYFCLLSFVLTAAWVSMMFYACLKRQGYLITFMHVLGI